jgi:hypothetical protein
MGSIGGIPLDANNAAVGAASQKRVFERVLGGMEAAIDGVGKVLQQNGLVAAGAGWLDQGEGGAGLGDGKGPFGASKIAGGPWGA